MRHTSHWDRTKYLHTCVHDSATCVVSYMCGRLHVWLATCVVGYMCGWLHVWLATCGWLHVWLATCVVGYMRGWLHVWLATCAVGYIRGWLRVVGCMSGYGLFLIQHTLHE